MDNVKTEYTSGNNSDSIDIAKKSKKATKLKASAELKDKLKDLPDVLGYIMLLEKYIEKQKRKIRKLKGMRVCVIFSCL